MEEVELKILEIDPVVEIKKLKDLGFSKVWEGRVLEKFFDMPNKYLKKQKKILRLRKAYGVVELVVKEKIEAHSFLKIRDEKELIVDSFESTIKLLESLGFVCFASREKNRISFKLNNVKVEIDEYPGVMPFMEIEGSKDDVFIFLKKLNHPLKSTTNKSNSKLLKLYGLDPKNVFFK